MGLTVLRVRQTNDSYTFAFYTKSMTPLVTAPMPLHKEKNVQFVRKPKFLIDEDKREAMQNLSGLKDATVLLSENCIQRRWVA